jgi:hypothetical protein
MFQKLADPQMIHDAIVRQREQQRFLVEVVKANFDPRKLLAEYHNIVKRHAIRESLRKDGSTLRSISLTHRPGASEPLYDGNNTQYDPATDTKLFLESDFTEFNEAFRKTSFYEIYCGVPFRVGRMRLNLLPPLTVFAMHRDSAPRAHVALDTNKDCFLTSGDGQAHHVPADGNVYVFDTTLPHTALNASGVERIHLTMSLAEEE